MMETAQRPDSSLKTRIRSALFFAPLVLVVIYIGGVPFTLMMAAAAAIGVQEWMRMVLPERVQLARLSAALTGVGVASSGVLENPVAALCFLLALCFLVFAVNVSQDGPSVKLSMFGMVYIGFSFDVMVWLRGGTSVQGLYYLVTLLLIVWASDIAAYFTGKTIGGPKLAPKISPKKTWSGFMGSSVGAGLVAAALASPALTQKLDVDTLGDMTVIGYGVMGFILAMFGQAGDLLISLFKRRFNVKDTGILIPGHGGILDRVDALLLVSLVFGFIVMVMA
jgi:phosphatidate cytidylyltransferase